MADVAAILLAAGESTRMKQNKALLLWQGLPLVRYQVQSIRAAGYGPVIVVVGHEADQVRTALEPESRVTIVENTDYRQGRSISVLHGLRRLPADMAGILIANVDQPRPPAIFRQLREAFLQSLPVIAVPAYQGQAGHPPLFNASLLPELLRISEEREGLNEVHTRHRDARLLVETGSPLALVNLNTPADYERALRLANA